MEPACGTHELLLRTRDSLKVVRSLPAHAEVAFASAGSVCKYSASGSKLAFVDMMGLRVVSSADFSGILRKRHPEIQFLDFSPSEHYLVTWEKVVVGSPNLLVWALYSGDVVYEFSYARNPKVLWPLLLFSQDDSLLYRQLDNAVLIYKVGQDQPIVVLDDKRVTTFSISPAQGNLVVYTGEMRGDPALITLYSNNEGAFNEQHSLSVPAVNEVQVLWNHLGSTALIWCQTDVDSTGRSYYGEHFLFLGSTNKKTRRFKITEGPLYDVKWAPSADQFIEVSGFMPAKATLYRGSGAKLTEISQDHRNTIRWNQFGDLLLLGGFGNLSGDIDVYETESFTLLGSCRPGVTVACEWAPCGRLFISATLSPRLRVDNGYKLYKYTGELLIAIPAENELWYVQWRASEAQLRPLSPRHKAHIQEKKQTYRAPGSTTDFAEKFRSAKQRDHGLGLTAPNEPKRDPNLIPGLDPELLKKKRRKKKKKEGN